ncbi:MAG TPA: indolepyruvate oxidoreductase subunit beta [Tissierellia bacterium]|nr:indolepyruvate oxidoreductase subunit beta [Tissierellia bacterium]
MMTKNILLAAVGGQGLVLATGILAEVALRAGLDVKTNDVIGLSQRGGKIMGSVVMGDKIHSPNIAPQQGDILIAFEALEAKRMLPYLKDGAIIIKNDYEMAPSLVQQEKREYDPDIDSLLDGKGEVIRLDATAIAKRIGHPAVANILMLGVAARYIEIEDEIWHQVIQEHVPPKSIELNLEAFDLGKAGTY